MEVLPGLLVDPQPASNRIRLTTLKLVDLLCRLPVHSLGPKFATVRHYYRRMASTPNIEYDLMELVRSLGGDGQQLADLTNGLLVLVSASSAAAMSCSFGLLEWSVSQQRSFQNLKALITAPIDYMSQSSEYRDFAILLLLSFVTAPSYYFGSKEGQCELMAGLVVQLAPLLLLVGDLCGLTGGGEEGIDAVSLRLRSVLSRVGAKRQILNVFAVSAPFNPWHDHIDLLCVSLFVGSFVLLLFSHYCSRSMIVIAAT